MRQRIFRLFQLHVQAIDGGGRTGSRQKRLNVNVKRNKNSPEYEGEQPFIAEVSERDRIGGDVIQLKAKDRDTDVSSWNYID